MEVSGCTMEIILDVLASVQKELKSVSQNLFRRAENGEDEKSSFFRFLLSEREKLEGKEKELLQQLERKEKELQLERERKEKELQLERERKEKELQLERERERKEKELQLERERKEKELQEAINERGQQLAALFLEGKDEKYPVVRLLKEEKENFERQNGLLWGSRLGTAALGVEARADLGTSATNSAELAAAIASHLLNDSRGWVTLGKRDSVSISGVNSTAWHEVLHSQNLSFKPWRGRLVPSHRKVVAGFGWDDRQESAQADRYLPHLQKSVTTPRSDCWVNGNSDKNMLTVETADLPFRLKGTTDVAICTKEAVRCLNPTVGLRVLFELKKEVKKEGQYQALAALVAANILCPDLRPVLVYTDLNEVWLLHWIDGSTLYGLSQERADVLGLVEDLLREGDCVRMEDDGRCPFLHRRTILGAARALDREGDIANMGDLEGMLPQEEITLGRQLLLFQELCKIPAVWQLRHLDSISENRSIPGMSQEPHSSPPNTMYL